MFTPLLALSVLPVLYLLWWIYVRAGLGCLTGRTTTLYRKSSFTQKWAKSIGGIKPPSPGFVSISNEQNRESKFPRLGRPVSSMRPEYDVVVVGSGYGGGVAASRMARAGKTVAVLELGLERWPGEYPSTLNDVAPEYHVSGNIGKDVTTGNPTGLYHTVKGEGQDVFIGHGLGGTSLINSNVYLRADPRTLQIRDWPPEIRTDPSSLDMYYARAEKLLQPTPYPNDYPSLRKLEVFQQQAKALGQGRNFYRVPQTTFFQDGLNNVGVELKGSTCTGQDCTGINDGSKNSVLMNYLPDAWNWGAEIFCGCEVRHIRKDSESGGYLVFYAWHGDGRESFKDTFYDQLMWVRAKELCFLGAGALGTTEILLRSKAHGMAMSPLVGQKLSGNGDILSFAYNTNEIINGIGSEKPSTPNPCGPTITGIIDNRGSEAAPNVEDGYVIEEGAIPEALAPIIQAMLETQTSQVYPKHYARLRCFLSRLKSIIMGPYADGCSVNRTQSFLVMCHGDNEGILTLENDKPRLQFLGAGRRKHMQYLHGILQKATEAVGGVLINSPPVTVHPLGGARMSFDGTGRQGAVNNIGQLFNSGGGEDVYEGIVCVDGSIIPTALSVNPFATITALAERSCDLLIKKNNWTVNEASNGKLDLFGKPAKSVPISTLMSDNLHGIKSKVKSAGIRFSEIMEGSIHIGTDIEDFTTAEKIARGASSSARLCVSVDVPNMDNLIGRSFHTALASGTFSCGALSQDPLLVTKGRLHFFTVDDDVSDGTNITYTLTLLSTRGETYVLQGHKKIDSDITFSGRKTWKATTTLFTTIARTNGSLVGKGILHISGQNFINELLSFSPSGDTTGTGMLPVLARFLGFFTRQTLDYVLSPFRPLEYPDTSTTGYFRKPTPVKALVTAEDGVETVVKLWKPTGGVAEHDMAIVFIPGASVDDQIFSLPTIPTNAVDYFTALGYRCYIPVLRFGIGGPAEDGWTAYDARLDVKAAMAYIREQESGRKFYVVCHCLGSITTAIALLSGEVKKEWIQGMTCSQVFCNLRYSPDNAFKAGSPQLVKAYRGLAGDWFSCSSTPTSPIIQYLIDQILRFYPIGASRETCNSSVCHRCNLVFGRCFTHAHLNHATHLHLANFFSGIHMNFLEHLMGMGAEPPHHVRTNQPEFKDLVVEKGNLERLEGLQIQWLSGGANVVFDPRSTAESYEMFKERFPEGEFERVVVPRYGHLDTWMGKGSFKDVYPRVRAHVEKCEEGGRKGETVETTIGEMEVVRQEKEVGGRNRKLGWFGGFAGSLRLPK
ncbi:FAD/NAD(P)-binding domain-containing protein [Lindgomyces ingoldianus]|uniref:FAD/NAD(P)-binding domain-containing protein n=1 Tax=Lindgomyces ingoldianus TaxID=673940 RepID=A0ACB6REA3_9PLEO|nr:FAD/NAD(P)-binding domain-containing protein [Lindgomyces ingoldianus]KAF2477526.1 FAD/NAD(P)-binding domain-containing protein [Lindgomyces ingoldianus]